MKKLILILIIAAASLNSQAQYGVPDTLAYLQTLVANKNQFIGQPFSKLSDSLRVQIKYFSPFPSLPYDKDKETSTTLAFYKPNTPGQVYLIYPCIEVYWYPFLNASQSNVLYGNTGGGWTTNVAAFYSNGVVADIKLID